MPQSPDKLNDWSDETLMAAYQTGSYDAFVELYRRHSGRVYGYLSSRVNERAMLDDVFQTVFLRLHRFRGEYEVTLPFLPWLYTLTRNVLADHYRSTLRRTTLEAEAAKELAVVTAVPPASGAEPAVLAPSATWARIQDAAGEGAISAAQLEALRMRYREDFPFEKIASVLQTSPANVRQLVSRALRRLRGFRALWEEGK